MEGLKSAEASTSSAVGDSKKSPDSVSTPGAVKVIIKCPASKLGSVYVPIASKRGMPSASVLPSASAKHVVRILQGSSTSSPLYKVSMLPSDAVQVVAKPTTSKSITTSWSSSFEATSTLIPAKVVSISSESIANLGSYVDSESNSTPCSLKVIDLSCDSAKSSASVNDAVSPATAIGEYAQISGSLGDTKLPYVSVSTLNSIREKLFQSGKVSTILPKDNAPSDSLLGQHRVLTDKKDSPKSKDEPISLPAKYISKRKSVFKCSICSFPCSFKSTLNKHMTRKHPDFCTVKPKQLKLICPECSDFKGMFYKDLVYHMNCMHNKHMKVLYKHFPSEEKCEQWKANIEKETCSKFTALRGAQQTSDNKMKLFYYCHRSGPTRISQAKKRKQKAQGSSKIGFHCTAYIKKSTDMIYKTVDIEYCLDHFGHDCDPAHQPISKDLKRTIAHRLTQGDDPWDILEDVKSQNLKCQRDAMLTMKDIHNIMYYHKISRPWNKNTVHLCSACNFQAKSRGGLLVHARKKHHQRSIASNEADVTDASSKACESTAEPDVHDENKDLWETLQSSETVGENMTQSLGRRDISEKTKPSELVQVKASIMQTLHDLKQTVVETSTLSVLQEIDKNLMNTLSFALEYQLKIE